MEKTLISPSGKIYERIRQDTISTRRFILFFVSLMATGLKRKTVINKVKRNHFFFGGGGIYVQLTKLRREYSFKVNKKNM